MESKNIIEITINGEIIKNVLWPIEFTNRVDELLDSGVFSFMSKTLNENIKPFSECVMNINGDITYWYASSECIKQMGEKSVWRHNVALIEPTKILEKIIIGSKAFSQVTGNERNNAQTIKLLMELVHQNTNFKFNFDYETTNPDSKLNDTAREYIFSAGTTMFDVLYDIGKSMNAIPRMINFSDITYDYLDDNETFELNYDYVEFDSTNQDVEYYCDSLIAEVTDVVDRDDTTIAENLTFRSDTVEISEDSAKLVLPSDIWEVKKLSTSYGVSSFTPIIVFEVGKYYDLATIDAAFPYANGYSTNFGKNTTITKYSGSIPTASIDGIIKEKLPLHYADFSSWQSGNYPYGYGTNYESSSFLVNNKYYVIMENNVVYKVPNVSGNKSTLDLTDLLYEKSQYDLLEAERRAGKIYYTSGSNSIEGWSTDFSGVIFGINSADSLLSNLVSLMNTKIKSEFVAESFNTLIDGYWYTSRIYDYDNDLVKMQHVPTTTFTSITKKVMGFAFDVEYYPIVDCLIQTGDETSFMRSYENSANTTDLTLINGNIESVINQIGHQERSITLQKFVPKPRQKIDEWYITNVMTSISAYYIRSTVDMSKEYSKVHDLIGVPSQYNSVLLPQDTEVARYILLKAQLTQEEVDKINYLKIETSQYDYSVNVIKLKVSDNRYILNVSMQDSYALATRSVYASSSIREKRDVPLGNGNNELSDAVLSYINYPSINDDDLFSLPLTPRDNFTTIKSFEKHIIHKDSREKLIFTLIVDVV